MGDDGKNKDKPKRSRRVNRKRKALSVAKQLTPIPVMWNVCVDTANDLWQVLIVDQLTKRRIAKGKVTKGKSHALQAFTDEMQGELDKRL